MYETIELERRGGAALIRLNRPEALNAWNTRARRRAAARGAQRRRRTTPCAPSASRAAAAPSPRAPTCATSPRAGARRTGEIDVYTTLTTVYHPILTTLRRMPKPVVAAINGPAAGIGCSLALACDLLVCAEPAYMLLAFVNIGLVPDGGALAFVSARAGAGRAAQMAMLGERIAAATLLEWGLVDEVVPGDELPSASAPGSTRSPPARPAPTRASSASSTPGCTPRLDEQLELEARVQQERVTSADFARASPRFSRSDRRTSPADEPRQRGYLATPRLMGAQQIAAA